jgi:RNA polymerase primary sigma factor
MFELDGLEDGLLVRRALRALVESKSGNLLDSSSPAKLLPRARAPQGSRRRTRAFEKRDVSLFDGWYRQIGHYELLSRDEVTDLARMIESGRGAAIAAGGRESALDDVRYRDAVLRGDSARSRIVLHNLRLVRLIVLRQRRRSPDFELDDAFQSGVLGLMRAVDKFDWRRGHAFSTYATWWIRQSLEREWMLTSTLIHIPVHVWSKLDRPSDGESAWEVAPEVEAVSGLKNAAQVLNGAFTFTDLEATEESVSEETSDEDSAENYVTHVDGVDSRVERVLREFARNQGLDVDGFESLDLLSDVQYCRALLKSLGKRERVILMLRYGFGSVQSAPMTLDEIGILVGLTRERIRQIEAKALNRLRLKA